jgi:DNA-binding GntR family transcriptional regulator
VKSRHPSALASARSPAASRHRKSPPAKTVPTGYERSVDVAYRKLRELIVRGRLAPGTRLVEADIAERFEISRTPVRSALHRLLQEGYVMAVRSARQSRLAVAPLTKEDSRELYWIVGHIEGLAGRLLARCDPQTRARVIERLKAINAELSVLAQTRHGDPSRIFDLDMGFHRVLVESAAGPRLLAIHAAIKPQTERYWRLYASAIIDDLGESVREHVAIIEGIDNGDPDAAEQAIRINWQRGAERLARVIDSLGERGSW